jgi:hypothetical protein
MLSVSPWVRATVSVTCASRVAGSTGTAAIAAGAGGRSPRPTWSCLLLGPALGQPFAAARGLFGERGRVPPRVLTEITPAYEDVVSYRRRNR